MKRKIRILLAGFFMVSIFSYAAGDGEATGSGEVPTLNMFGGQIEWIGELDSPENTFTVYMEEKFGVKIKWTIAPNDTRREKQNLLLASGDYPEIFWHGDFTNSDQMKYGGQGVLQPLNGLIENYGPDILDAFEFKPYFRPAITTPDGNIYTIPGFGECYHCMVRQKLWMNITWLDKLGLDFPETTEELESTLKAFKNRDPNGNGRADEIPMSGAVNTWMADVWYYLMTPHIYNDGERFLYYNSNNEIDLAANKPEWRDGLRYAKRLYDQGLIDPQAFTQNLDEGRAVMNGEEIVIGSYTAGHNRMFPLNEGLWQQYLAVHPVRGPKGIRQSAYYPSGVRNGIFAITNKASDLQAQKAMEMASYSYTVQGTLEQVWGLGEPSLGRASDAKNWRWAKEGELGLDGKKAIYYGSPHASDKSDVTDNWAMELIFWHFDLFNGWQANQDTTTIEGYERFLVLSHRN